jgi:hypothetical protein
MTSEFKTWAEIEGSVPTDCEVMETDAHRVSCYRIACPSLFAGWAWVPYGPKPRNCLTQTVVYQVGNTCVRIIFDAITLLNKTPGTTPDQKAQLLRMLKRGMRHEKPQPEKLHSGIFADMETLASRLEHFNPQLFTTDDRERLDRVLGYLIDELSA